MALCTFRGLEQKKQAGRLMYSQSLSPIGTPKAKGNPSQVTDLHRSATWTFTSQSLSPSPPPVPTPLRRTLLWLPPSAHLSSRGRRSGRGVRKGIGTGAGPGPTHNLLLGFGVCAMPPPGTTPLRSESKEGQWNRELLGKDLRESDYRRGKAAASFPLRRNLNSAVGAGCRLECSMCVGFLVAPRGSTRGSVRVALLCGPEALDPRPVYLFSLPFPCEWGHFYRGRTTRLLGLSWDWSNIIFGPELAWFII
jgi:hypothetical protein